MLAFDVIPMDVYLLFSFPLARANSLLFYFPVTPAHSTRPRANTGSFLDELQSSAVSCRLLACIALSFLPLLVIVCLRTATLLWLT